MSGINRYYYLEKKRRGFSEAKEAPISDVLDKFLKKCHIDYNPYEDKVAELFKQLCGKTVAKYVTDISMHGQILNVRVSLPTIKAELMMVRDAMKDTINRTLGKNIVKSIVIK